MSSGHKVEYSPAYDLSSVQYSDFSKVNYFQQSDTEPEPETANEQSKSLSHQQIILKKRGILTSHS